MTEKKSPFDALAKLATSLPAGPVRIAAPPPQPDEFEAKVVVARTKKGRGGKTVTLVSGVKAGARDALAKEMKRALGCAASLEDDAIALHGDLGDRARAWLEARGARKIVVGS